VREVVFFSSFARLAMPHAPGSAVTCLAALGPFAIATGGSDGLVCCWRLSTDATGATAQLVATLGGAAAAGQSAGSARPRPVVRDEVRAVAALSQGRLLVASWSGRLACWSPDDASWAECGPTSVAYTQTTSWEAHCGPAWALCALPDDEAASSGGDGCVRVWTAPSAQQRADGPRLTLRAGAGTDVSALCLLACARVLASGGTDAAVRLWRLSDGQLLALLQGHSDSVTALAPTAAGGVASASGDRSLRVWQAPCEAPAAPEPPEPHPAASEEPPAYCTAGPQCLPGTPAVLVAAASFNALGFLASLNPRALPKALHQLLSGDRGSGRDAPGAHARPTVLAAHANPVTALAALSDGRLLSAAVGACVWAPVAGVAGTGGGGAWRCARLLGEGPSVRHQPVAGLAVLPRPSAFLGDPVAAPGCLAAAVAGCRLRVWDVNCGSVVLDAALTGPPK